MRGDFMKREFVFNFQRINRTSKLEILWPLDWTLYFFYRSDEF